MPPRENVKLVGTIADHTLRDFLTRADQPYEGFDAETGRELLARHGVAEAGLPVVIIDDELVLVRPTLEQLADALGVRVPPKHTDYDVVIVGAGSPAPSSQATSATARSNASPRPSAKVPPRSRRFRPTSPTVSARHVRAQLLEIEEVDAAPLRLDRALTGQVLKRA
jgi:hypothetical protein